MDSTAKSQLRSFVERIECLEEEKKATVDSIKDVYGEAKATGFDTPALRAVIKRRQQDRDELKQHEAILGTYLRALGMVPMEEHWGAPKDDFADTKVTISVPGSDLPPVETTAGNLQKAADALDTPHGRKALKEFVARI